VQFIPRINEIDRDSLHTYVEQNFSAHVMAEKYEEIYEKVIKTNKDRAAARKRLSVQSAPDRVAALS